MTNPPTNRPTRTLSSTDNRQQSSPSGGSTGLAGAGKSSGSRPNSQRTFTTQQLVVRTGQHPRTIRHHIEEGLITPAGKRLSPNRRLTNYFTAAEVADYEAYLVSAGLMRKRKRHRVSRKDRRRAILASVAKVGKSRTAEAFGIKPESLDRNLRNWREREKEVDNA